MACATGTADRDPTELDSQLNRCSTARPVRANPATSSLPAGYALVIGGVGPAVLVSSAVPVRVSLPAGYARGVANSAATYLIEDRQVRQYGGRGVPLSADGVPRGRAKRG